MQVWPPKELPISQMSDETSIRGVTLHEFNEILKQGFAKMYVQSRENGVDPAAPMNADRQPFTPPN